MSRHLPDVRDGHDHCLCDHDRHRPQLLLPWSHPDRGSPLGEKVSLIITVITHDSRELSLKVFCLLDDEVSGTK